MKTTLTICILTALCIEVVGQELPKLSDTTDKNSYVHNKRVLDTYLAKVVGVSDGDTIDVLTADKKKVRIRIDSIDAPEKDQPFGTKAKSALAASIFGKVVTVQKTGDDKRYKRTVAFVQLDGRDVSTAMVAAGFAWEYTQYSDSDSLGKLQTVAQKEKRGLWADPKATPPWKFRRSKKKKTSSGPLN